MKLNKKIAEIENRLKSLEPEKINIKERIRKKQWNKLDVGKEDDAESCSCGGNCKGGEGCSCNCK